MTGNEIRLKIRGMHCQGCTVSISESLKEVPGVESVEIDLKSGIGLVRSSRGLDPSRLIKAVKEVGYTAKEA